jgi:hypothetical protein
MVTVIVRLSEQQKRPPSSGVPFFMRSGQPKCPVLLDALLWKRLGTLMGISAWKTTEGTGKGERRNAKRRHGLLPLLPKV